MRSKMLILGVVLEGLGLLGFVLPSPLLGLFAVNTVLNVIHIGSGALAIAASFRGIGSMRAFGRLLGFLYLGLAILGFAAPDLDIFQYVTFQGPDNWLHLGVAIGFLYLAFLAPPN